MTTDLGLMVFTDLDGTLIDHDTYRWAAADKALDALRRAGCAVVLASSKTAAEIGGLRKELNFENWPAIVENGAGVLPPFSDGDQDVTAYLKLRSVLDQVPSNLRSLFCGFGDLTAAGVSETTGLPAKDAALAKKRAFSEPGSWSGSENERAEFLAHLKAAGITAQQGGRFLTLSFGGNKADQVKALTDRYAPRHTVALGDAPNDIQMLESTEYGVVVSNPNRPPLGPLKGEAEGRIIRTTAAGPEGWNLAILGLLKKLDLKRN